ncbi:MAG: hypothetical protein ACRECJ_05635 [Limisphaerales bacterium]
MPAIPNPNGTPDAGLFCPVYYPQTGEGLKELARRLAPVLAKTGWRVRLAEGGEGEFFLELQNKEGHSRRISPEEALAWQALLPQLSGLENLFSTPGLHDRKES